MWKLVVLAGFVIALGAAAVFVQVGGDASDSKPRRVAKGRDLSNQSAEAPPAPIDIVFLHHSVGEQLLAAAGPAVTDKDGIQTTHPNGGGLGALMAKSNYRVHEATYGSALGEHTDLFDWLPKFRDQMAAVLAIERQDAHLPDGARNQVVMFKSCFPNSDFVGRGTSVGNPEGPELTEANARATMTAVREELAKHPEVLFVYLTAPPQAPKTWTEPAWRWLVKKALGRTSHTDEVRASGEIARDFNNWMTDPQGWLRDYPHRNIVVFDFFNALTGNGASNFSRYATGDGWDSHPSGEGNSKVAPELVAFLNRAVRYAGVVR